jgi:hypothetical protein
MRAIALAAILASLGACEAAAPAPTATAPPTDEEIARACAQPEHDAREAALARPGPDVPSDWAAPQWDVRGSSCTLAEGRIASCRFEIALVTLDEFEAAERPWKRARGRFRYLGKRVAYSRWYPVDETACAAESGADPRPG